MLAKVGLFSEKTLDGDLLLQFGHLAIVFNKFSFIYFEGFPNLFSYKIHVSSQDLLRFLKSSSPLIPK